MKRKIENILLKRLEEDRSVALLGPRQVGKSYLLQMIVKNVGGSYLNLDDPLLREEIARDPLNYLRKQYATSTPLFIDEAAKVPPIFDAIKILIDEQGNKPSKICLANSGNYLLMKRVKESLAGRITLLSLYPFSWQEFSGQKNRPGLIKLLEEEKIAIPISQPLSFTEVERMRSERLLWGGYPVPTLSKNPEARIRWVSDYFRTYVFPILIEQFNIRAVEAFEKCARLLFLQSSQVLNYHRLAQETGVSQPTVTSYVHQLKAMMLIIILETYFKNPRKRLLKHPKIHVVDPLLLHYSFGTNFNLQIAKERKNLGAIYESFITFEIIKLLENYGIPNQLYCWRTADRAEVDLVLEALGKTIPLEIKLSENLTRKDASGLHAFLEDNPQVEQGYIIYPGREVQQISPGVTALPDWWLLGAY